MSIYRKFCNEEFGAQGELTDFTLNFPDDFNFGYDVVDEIARTDPNKRALVWCNAEGEEHVFSFGDIKRLSDRAANIFLSAEIGQGDPVMLMLKRHYEYWIIAVALHKIGAVMIPATHMLTAEDMIYRIKMTKVKGIVCTPFNEVPEKLTEAINTLGADCKLWCVQQNIDGYENFTSLLDKASEKLTRIPTKASDPMVMYFTSGTTDYPKGVIHDHSYPLAHIVTAKYWQQAEDNGLHFTVAETGWAKASWGKIYGQWLVGSAVMVFDFDHFDPKQLTAVINRYGVTSFCAPPTVYRYLVKKGMPAMPKLKHASTAGELLHPEIFRRFTESTGLDLCEGYGQTETTLLMANFKGCTPVEGSMGRPSPFYNIQLRKKDGSKAEIGEVGEVVIIPPENGRQIGLFTAYLDDEARYANAFEGGVYHTGDAAWQDKEGNFWFYGRFDDIIKTGGFRVGPFEIENVLMEHPAVVECVVIGIPDKLRGQAIKAFILPAQGYDPTKALELEIKEFCNARLAEYKWVRSIEFVDVMPKTISGKIRKGEMRLKA